VRKKDKTSEVKTSLLNRVNRSFISRMPLSTRWF